MKVFPLSTTSDIFIAKALPLLEKCYEQISYLNPNKYPEYPHKPFRHLLAFGASVAVHVFNDGCVFETWKQLYLAHPKQWIFAYISYDAKNSVEVLTNSKEPGIEFNAACFFIPQHIWEITAEGIIIHKGNASALIQEIEAYEDQKTDTATTVVSFPQPLISKETYLNTISRIQLFLEEGNAYEINFCMPFKGKGTIQPANTYLRLNKLVAMPFSGYFKNGDQYILSASPERFIKKEGSTLLSQPIKGTSKRGSTASEDEALKIQLKNSEKEQSENTMIVDLVRNDLSRTAIAGSVKVAELRGMYTFPNVHQLISTVVSELHPDYNLIDAIQYAFPMGSMTGAPKVSAMKLIDELEPVSRGPFSGTIGYIDPEGNGDFNVLIRSIFYNNQTQTIFMEAGSAITYYADAEKEFAECMLKIAPMLQIIQEA